MNNVIQLTLAAHLKMGAILSKMYNELGEVMPILGMATDRSATSTYQMAKKLDMQIEALTGALQEQFDTTMSAEEIETHGHIYYQGIPKMNEYNVSVSASITKNVFVKAEDEEAASVLALSVLHDELYETVESFGMLETLEIRSAESK